jgi:hypothetical protein
MLALVTTEPATLIYLPNPAALVALKSCIEILPKPSKRYRQPAITALVDVEIDPCGAAATSAAIAALVLPLLPSIFVLACMPS